ncbi:alpha-2,3-sialyltransferase [Helicobacter cynogastricus]|uniref:alpha-2,3-sialyltransferase n=1 Tax=Helicobacter cynogastricus TaxID=329937 RepID=UPI000CF109B2|nr:alpha-2,3-sialyltransferase [Helicobacter cynogastricus]
MLPPPPPQQKPLIVAGNGPSVKNLDYNLFPPDFEVFRCNQFYFEDKYYLGKEIKGAFFNPNYFELQMHTMRLLYNQGEYDLCDLYCTTNNSHHYINGKSVSIRDFLDKNYTGVRTTHNLLETLEPFYSLHAKSMNFKNQWFTSGVVMLICAIALGYKEIYLAGIDFYTDGPGHFYPNRSTFFKIHTDPAHSKNLDIEAIELATEFATIYSLVPDTLLTQIVPLSPHKNALSAEIKERLRLGQAKPDHHISDIVLPPHYSEDRRKVALKEFFASREVYSDNLMLESLRFCRRVCCDVYKFGRACLALCKPKNFKLIFKRNKPTP